MVVEAVASGVSVIPTGVGVSSEVPDGEGAGLDVPVGVEVAV